MSGPIRLVLVLWTSCIPIAVAHGEGNDRREGIVFVVGGVSGLDPLGISARYAFRQEELPLRVHDFVWTHCPGRILRDLQDHRHVEAKAGELANLIRQAKSENPQAAVYLLAKSGGTGLALQAAEQLPANTLERIILLSAAVSPNFDLRPALQATRHEIVSFHSVFDQFLLNWGTSTFGTIDRVYGPSAGLHGFQTPEDASEQDERLYRRRVVQVPWDPSMLLCGYAGCHMTNSLPCFLRRYVVPWLN